MLEIENGEYVLNNMYNLGKKLSKKFIGWSIKNGR